ncbi:MAG TPA: FAD-dependent oxidoreductase, partial [Actinomycetota bacterium]
WIGPLPTDPGVSYPQKRLYQLAVDLGIKTFRTYNKGAYLDYSNGRLIRYHGRIPPDPGAANAGYAIQALDRMAEKVPPDAPWRAVSAIEWDSQTFETWMKSNLVPPAVPPTFTTSALVNLAVESVFAAEPRDVSLLHVLWYIRNAGSLNNLVDTAGGAQDSRFVGGSQLVSIRMAEQLGDRVILRSPVRTIAQASGHVDVSTDRVTVRGDRVIVAIPPTLTRGIRFDPGLATFDWGARDQLAQRTPMGTTIKVMCLYPTPFWRGEGLAGQVTSDAGPVKITFDNSPYPDWRPGVLVGFFEGDAGREWGRKTQAQRRAATIGSLVRYFGPKAGRPIGYIEKVWAAEEFTGGCYGAFFPPGVWTQYGATLRRPLGRLHWAGTETATSWAGYMEGAVESGQRVAAEVMAALGSAAARR